MGAESAPKAPSRTVSGSLASVSSGSSGQFPRSGATTTPDSSRLERAFDASAPSVRSLARIVLSPGSELLEATHAFVTSYIASRLNPQIAQRVSLAAYELTDNALSYSTMGEDIGVEIFEGDRQIAVRVSNQTIAARISMLNEHVAKVMGNPEQALTDEMRRSVMGGPRPMLGLARVAHEASMTLNVGTEGRRVTVTAFCRR